MLQFALIKTGKLVFRPRKTRFSFPFVEHVFVTLFPSNFIFIKAFELHKIDLLKKAFRYLQISMSSWCFYPTKPKPFHLFTSFIEQMTSRSLKSSQAHDKLHKSFPKGSESFNSFFMWLANFLIVQSFLCVLRLQKFVSFATLAERPRKVSSSLQQTKSSSVGKWWNKYWQKKDEVQHTSFPSHTRKLWHRKVRLVHETLALNIRRLGCKFPRKVKGYGLWELLKLCRAFNSSLAHCCPRSLSLFL